MSLAIDVDKVTAVLLRDGWYVVTSDSFALDSYEFVWGEADNQLLLGGGQDRHTSSVGFEFYGYKLGEKESRGRYAGPIQHLYTVRQGGQP